MPYADSTIIANNILARSFAENSPVTPMKLQKILYFVASEYAKRTGTPLFEERFGAWPYGPVLRRVYDEFRPFGSSPITVYATQDALGNYYQVSLDSDEDLRIVIDRVWEKTKSFTGVALSRITHNIGSAWYQAWEEKPFLDQNDIREDRTYQQELGLTPPAPLAGQQ